jgi:PAS domain S-box-containing protein
MTITRLTAFHGIRPLSCRMTNTQNNPSSTKSEPRERFFDHILNCIPDLIFVKDESHRWVYVNNAFCAALGHRREALIGKTDYDVHPKAEADIFWEKDNWVLEGEGTNVNEEVYTNASGELRTWYKKRKDKIKGK